MYRSETWNLMSPEAKTTKWGMQRIMFGITWRDKKRASWIGEQTKVEDILTTIIRKKWTWAGHMCQTENKITIRLTKWQHRDGKSKQSRQRMRWRDEIWSFDGVTWNRRTADRGEWMLGETIVLQRTHRWWWWWMYV